MVGSGETRSGPIRVRGPDHLECSRGVESRVDSTDATDWIPRPRTVTEQHDLIGAERQAGKSVAGALGAVASMFAARAAVLAAA